MSATKPVKLYYHSATPNPWKVYIFIEELSLPYELVDVPHEEVKNEPFISKNPNGRLPALEDPNTGVTVWESGAIIEYLLETYDKDHKLWSASSPQKYQEASWKHFQMSGQGPYFGQMMWFMRYHPEKIQSAIERYQNEVRRVWSVIDSHLSKQGTPYLVGEKVSYADLMFVPWNNGSVMILGAEELGEKYPKAFKWHQSLLERESVKKMVEKLMGEMKKAGLA